MEFLDSFDKMLDAVKSNCRKSLSEVAYSLWIEDLEADRFEGSAVYLKVKTYFKQKVIEEKYLSLLKQEFSDVMGFEVDVVVFFVDSAFSADTTPQNTPDSAGEYEYTFDNFIVGSSNKFAHAASLAVAANPSNAYNPLFIYGSSGLGKTHLLYAICNEIAKSMPEKRIIFVNGEEFTNELIAAIRRESTAQFHDKYRYADILLVDDIQFIGGKESTQEEFFYTFNALYQDNKQIILTSDRPPKEIKTLEDRLRTRFEWGLLADIQSPDFETRTAIILRKAELLNFDLPPEVCEYIATRLKTNIRQLEGAVKKLRAYQQLENAPPSIEVAQAAIRDILNDNQPVPITIDRIVAEVSRTYGVSPGDIRSKKRNAEISLARHISMYVIREVAKISTPSIGEEFGGRDHSTVLYALQRIEDKMNEDYRFRETVEDIIKNVRST